MDNKEEVDKLKMEIIVETQQYNDKFSDYIKRLDSTIMKERLVNIIKILHSIIEYIKQEPKQAIAMRKIIDLYFPTLVNLLEFYNTYEKLQDTLEDIKKSLIQIEDTMLSIEKGLEKKMQELYLNQAYETNANMTVLKKMLNQDGLLDIKDIKDEKVEKDL